MSDGMTSWVEELQGEIAMQAAKIRELEARELILVKAQSGEVILGNVYKQENEQLRAENAKLTMLLVDDESSTVRELTATCGRLNAENAELRRVIELCRDALINIWELSEWAAERTAKEALAAIDAMGKEGE